LSCSRVRPARLSPPSSGTGRCLAANAEAAAEFAQKYLDDRGVFRCLERWGGNDGPDDVMENFHNWTLAFRGLSSTPSPG
jgi:hypothetical protein